MFFISNKFSFYLYVHNAKNTGSSPNRWFSNVYSMQAQERISHWTGIQSSACKSNSCQCQKALKTTLKTTDKQIKQLRSKRKTIRLQLGLFEKYVLSLKHENINHIHINNLK